MKTIHYTLLRPLFLVLVFTVSAVFQPAFSQEITPSQWPSLAGYWKFQNVSDLTRATVGNDLILKGTHQWVQGAYYGDTAVMIDTGSFYRCNHQIAPNGGGDSVNRYSLMFDFMVPNFNSWHTFQQTDSTNMNDGECFIKPQAQGIKSTIGTATTGYTPDSISPGVWYRMVISVCLDSFYRYYIDGNLWLEGNMQSVDGRFALTPQLLLFADNNQEDDTIHIGSVAIFDTCLTPAEVALLGNLNPCIANPPVIDLGQDTQVCENHNLTLDAGPGYKSYLWSTGATTQQVVLDTALCGAGTSTISVLAVDMNDCEARDSISVTFIDCSSIAEYQHNNIFNVFPNPFTDLLRVETLEDDCTLTLSAANGQILIQTHLSNKAIHHFDTGHLPQGIYFLQVTGKGFSSTRVVTK